MPATMPKRTEGTTPDQSVRLAGDVVQMARTITSVKGSSLSKLISDTCRPIFVKVIKQMQDAGHFIPQKIEDKDA